MESFNLSFKRASEIYGAMIFDACNILESNPKGCHPARDIKAFSYVLQGKINEGYPCVLPKAVIEELRGYISIRDPDEAHSQKRLIEVYQEMANENFLGINENEIAAQVKRSHPTYARYGVSPTDVNVLEHGIAFARSKIPAAIVTSDRGLIDVWRDYITEADISPIKFGCLTRRGIDNFELRI